MPDLVLPAEVDVELLLQPALPHGANQVLHTHIKKPQSALYPPSLVVVVGCGGYRVAVVLSGGPGQSSCGGPVGPAAAHVQLLVHQEGQQGRVLGIA